MRRLKTIAILILLLSVFISPNYATSGGNPPGVVIHHISKDKEQYIGSPSICVLSSGEYIASHDVFGPKSTEYQSAMTYIYISTNKGQTWSRQAVIHGQFWSNLFEQNGVLYIMGTNKHHGNLVIRKSTDKGKTWTNPYKQENGLLLEGEYHTAPVPILIHNGRIWRAIEYATGKTTKWGERYSAMMMSASVKSDLLNAKSWVKTNILEFDSTYLDGKFEAWLEGNAVLSPDGQVCNILRVASGKNLPEYVAIAKIGKDVTKLNFNSETGFIPFNGGSKKFTIRYDNKTKRYWTLVNYVDSLENGLAPASIRNKQVLCSSKDLKEWIQHETVLEHEEVKYHAFQYVDWIFDGDDIVLVSRTAYDDNTGGAYNAHNANYLTFHRLTNYAKMLN